MDKVAFGDTGLQVSRLGVGLAEIGSELELDDVDIVVSLINRALDSGVNFLDTSACYNISEELLGRSVSSRRSEYVLATKAGHATGGYDGEPWTYTTVSDSIDRSLVRMRTDHVDLVQLHTCGIDVLEEGDVIRALQDARDAGKTRFIGYSGDNDSAHWAVDSGLFDTLQTSFNLVDQTPRTSGLLEKADDAGLGIIVKRPVANSVWHAIRTGRAREDLRPYAHVYYDRALEIAEAGEIAGEPEDPMLTSFGFTLAHPQVDVVIAGTKNPDHLAANVKMVNEALPIDPGVVAELHRRFDELGDDWPGRT